MHENIDTPREIPTLSPITTTVRTDAIEAVGAALAPLADALAALAASLDTDTVRESHPLNPTDDEYEALKLEAANLGANAGRAAGSWYWDGRATDDLYRVALRGIADGDPAILDTFPCSPLSGERAGDLTPDSALSMIYDSCGIERTNSGEHDDEILSEYEQAYSDAASAEIERHARAQLGDTDTDPDTDADPEHVAEISAVFDLTVTVTTDASGDIRSVWALGQPDHVSEFDRGDDDFVEQLVERVTTGYTCAQLAEITTETEGERVTTDDTYNRWQNKPTWLVNIWLSNDEPIYNEALGVVRAAIRRAESEIESGSPYVTVGSEIADTLERWVTARLIGDPSASLGADLMGWALAHVNWRELAEHYEQAITELDGWSSDA